MTELPDFTGNSKCKNCKNYTRENYCFIKDMATRPEDTCADFVEDSTKKENARPTNCAECAKENIFKENIFIIELGGKTFGLCKKHRNSISVVKKVISDCIIDSFPDQYGTPWALVIDGQNKKLVHVDGNKFIDFIRVSIEHVCGQPREHWVKGIVASFASHARRRNIKHLHNCSVIFDDKIIFQIDELTALKIEDGNIDVTDCPPIFRYYSHRAPLTIDLNADIKDLNLLDKFCHFTNPWELELFKSTLCAYFIPSIPKPIQLVRGPPGSAKSTIGRVTKRLIEPTTAYYMGIDYPKNEGDLFVTFLKNSVVMFDNLGTITRGQQDQMSRVTTGTTIERRKLYTDDETVGGSIKGIVLVNALDLNNLQSDFIDRSLIWELERITDDKRLTETKFWADFDNEAARIRGAIFKVIAKASALIATIPASSVLRLADFGRWAAACAQARGESADEFIKSLTSKVEEQKDESLYQSVLYEPLLKFIKNKESWEGSATELHKELTKQEYGVTIGEGVWEHTIIKSVPKEWLKTPTELSKELTRIGFLLVRANIKFTRDRSGVTRKISIKNMGHSCVNASLQATLSSSKRGDGRE